LWCPCFHNCSLFCSLFRCISWGGYRVWLPAISSLHQRHPNREQQAALLPSCKISHTESSIVVRKNAAIGTQWTTMSRKLRIFDICFIGGCTHFPSSPPADTSLVSARCFSC
ncbi:hypothetical protein PFISCL1PPCAC_28642, partial [Pristionchus fissidentatus]